MTDRERLIELKINFIENFDCGNCKPSNDKCKKCLSENEADYLLEHGVIVLPCKAGDTVYYPWIYDGQCGVASNKVESIIICAFGLPLVIVEDWKSDMPMPRVFDNEDFGKTVFLTREEAERALKERAK